MKKYRKKKRITQLSVSDLKRIRGGFLKKPSETIVPKPKKK